LEEAWNATLPSAPVSQPARDGVRVFVPLAAELVALQWTSGDAVWSRPIAATSPAVVSNGTVYIAAGDSLHALDPETGEVRWTSHASGTLRLLVAAGPSLLGVGAGFAQAFDLQTGRLAWTRMLPPAGEPIGLAASDSALFATFHDARVVSLGTGDGAERWVRDLAGILSPPLLTPEAVYVGSTDNRFYSLDARTGKERWNWRAGGDVTGAAGDAKTVYYSSLDAMVRAVNAGNGNQRWKHDVGTRPGVPPIALDGSILVTGLSPALSALAPLTGAALGTFELPGEVATMPLVSATLTPGTPAVVVVLKDGRAFGLRALSLLFNENARQPLLTLPGKSLPRERPPEVSQPPESSGAAIGSPPDAAPAPAPDGGRLP
jgi:outer membrane protein assembly factor BamB